jgi:hypothetical protein
MALLDHFWVIQTTSTRSDADTEDSFKLGLLFTQPNPQFEIWLDFPDLPHDERERGRTDQYRFNIVESDTEISMELLQARNFAIATNGNDAWLPDSIWIIGQDVNEARRLLAGIPRWPSNLWFSTDLSEGRPRHSLDEGLT